MWTVIIQYPAGHDFDVEYYVNTHLPLAEKVWKKAGLKGWEVIKLGGESQYQIYTILRWDSAAAFQEAATSEGAVLIQEDVKHFTTAMPVLVFGEEVSHD
ncbi:hypothetical protein ACHAPJ_013344 [Fusarium lateritium]